MEDDDNDLNNTLQSINTMRKYLDGTVDTALPNEGWSEVERMKTQREDTRRYYQFEVKDVRG